VLLLLGGATLYLLLLLTGMIGAGESRVFMPLSKVETPAGTCTYTVFSSWHLADVANMLLLVAPLPLLVLLPLLVIPRGRAFLREPAFGFHLLASGFFFLFLFGANTSLGLARDWDLTAPLGVLIGFFALAALRRSEGRNAQLAACAFGVLALLGTLPWIATMRNTGSAAARFERVLALDEAHMYRDYALSGYEALRKYHQNAGDVDKDLQLSRKKIELIGYASNYTSFIGKSAALLPERAHDYLDAQRWMLGHLRDKAEALRSVGKTRDYEISFAQIDSLGELIAVTAFLNHQDSTLVAPLAALGHLTGYPYPYPSIQGMQAFLESRFADAADLLQASINHGFQHERVYLTLGTALGIMQRYSESLAAYEAGVRANPDNIPLLTTLAKYLLRARIRTEDAMLLLGRALELNPQPDEEREIRALIQQAQSAAR
jgi:tetratricopeptide (TPR) repeat protein